MIDAAPLPTPEPFPIVHCDPAPGYAPGIGRYVTQMHETRQELLRPVRDLDPEQLSWHPDEQTESIGTQLLHVAAVEWSWVFQEIFERPDDEFSGWEEAFPLRVGGPQVSGRPLAAYLEKLEAVRTEVLEALKGLSDDDLPRLVVDSGARDDPAAERYTIDWVLFHLVQHESHHAGQVELLARLLPRAEAA